MEGRRACKQQSRVTELSSQFCSERELYKDHDTLMASALWQGLIHAARLRIGVLRRRELAGELAENGTRTEPTHAERRARLAEDAAESNLTRSIKLVRAAENRREDAESMEDAVLDVVPPEEGLAEDANEADANEDQPLSDADLWQVKLTFLK